MQKCGSATPTSENVFVYGVDADGNAMIGQGAPTPSLVSRNPKILAVASPSPSKPNEFALVHPISTKSQGPATLVASVTPASYSGGVKRAASVSFSISGGSQICGAFTEFPTGLPTPAQPWGIAVGPDGALWFTVWNTNEIGRMTTSGKVTSFSAGLSVGDLQLGSIAAGPDGNLWFTEARGNRVGRITPKGAITEFASGVSNGSLGGIAAGPDGAMWYTEENLLGAGGIARITTSGVATLFTPSATLQPASIVAGPDGNLWFDGSPGSGFFHLVGKVSTAGAFTTYPPWPNPNALLAGGIAAGPDGALWFTTGGLGRVTTAGVVTSFPLKVQGQVQSVAAGPDGAMWFAENAGDGGGGEVLLVRIAMDGTESTPISVNDRYYDATVPGGIVAGPDGALWFTENCMNRIARVQ
jgi:virginiamycin B lyase